jgi:hypothetical protein
LAGIVGEKAPPQHWRKVPILGDRSKICWSRIDQQHN